MKFLDILDPMVLERQLLFVFFLDLIKPTRGKVEIFGKKVDKNFWNIKSRIGYLPGELHLYENLTGKEFLGIYYMFEA
jgi:ABC-type multidrug transport system ATPase subunit